MKGTAGRGSLELVTMALREPGSGEVRVRVMAAGICGTDLHILDGEWPVEAPVVIGHEMSGIVEAVGPGVEPSWLGARVVTEVFVGTDETCAECRAGFRNLCANRRALGSKWDGAFAEHVILPTLTLHRVPATISFLSAALLEPLACVTGALLNPARFSAGDSVLVTGPGAVGMLAAQVARAGGADVLLVGTERDRLRLEVAASLGFSTTVDTTSIPENSFDVVVECSGAESAAGLCLSAVKRRGRYVQLGIFGKPVSISFDLITLKDVSMSSGFGALPAGIESAIRLVVNGLVDLESLITHVAGLEDWEAQFAATRAGSGIKYIFQPTRSVHD